MNEPGLTVRAERRNMSSGQRHKQIISVAAMLFDKNGFAHTTMDDIAHEIGIAKPTLYHYFSSKDEILHAIHEEFIDLLLARHDLRAGSGLGSEQLLLEAMADILELMETHGGHVRVFFEHHRELPPDARVTILEKRNRYEQIIKDLYAEGIRRGVFREVDIGLATLATFGMCNWAYQWYRPGGKFRPREIAYQFWNFIVFGLGAEKLRD
jgi:AcrR family transcriptional regulator